MKTGDIIILKGQVRVIKCHCSFSFRLFAMNNKELNDKSIPSNCSVKPKDPDIQGNVLDYIPGHLFIYQKKIGTLCVDGRKIMETIKATNLIKMSIADFKFALNKLQSHEQNSAMMKVFDTHKHLVREGIRRFKHKVTFDKVKNLTVPTKYHHNEE